jgi:PHD-finger
MSPPSEDEEEHCQLCDQPNNTRMVQCDGCSKWYHFKCVGVGSDVKDINWLCRRCLEEALTTKEQSTSENTSEKASTSLRAPQQANENQGNNFEVDGSDDDDVNAILLLTQLEQAQKEKESLACELIQEKEARATSERLMMERMEQMESKMAEMREQLQSGTPSPDSQQRSSKGSKKEQDETNTDHEVSKKEELRKRLHEMKQREKQFEELKRRAQADYMESGKTEKTSRQEENGENPLQTCHVNEPPLCSKAANV